MESFSQTKKRSGDEDGLKSPPGKRRRSAGDTLAFLADKTEREKLEVRRMEAETAANTQANMFQQIQANTKPNATTVSDTAGADSTTEQFTFIIDQKNIEIKINKRSTSAQTLFTRNVRG